VAATLESTPTGAMHRSRASMAKASGLRKTTIERIWKDFGLELRMVNELKLSTDPLFVEKGRGRGRPLPQAGGQGDVTGRWTRRASFRPSIGPSRCTLWCPACPSGAPRLLADLGQTR
jgi:hypothetical protein